jgi:hypothetical protein
MLTSDWSGHKKTIKNEIDLSEWNKEKNNNIQTFF